MSTTSPPSDQEARTQRHIEFLDILIAQGVDLATRLHKQSTTPSDLSSALAQPGIAVPFITPEVIASFAQINQTVRRAILVSRKLAEPLPPARPGPCVSNKDSRAETPSQPAAEPLRTETADRLYSPDLEDRIGMRPIPETIVNICRDLGVDTNPAIVDPRSESTDSDTEAVTTLLPLHNHADRPERRPPKADLA